MHATSSFGLYLSHLCPVLLLSSTSDNTGMSLYARSLYTPLSSSLDDTACFCHFSCASFSGVNTKSTYTDARKVRLIHTPCKWSGWLWMSLTWNSGTIFLVFLEFSAKVPGVHTSIVWSTWRPPLLCSGKIGCYTVLVRCLVRVRHSISRMDVHTHPTLVFSHFQSPALNASYILSKAAINLSSQKLSHAAFIAIASLSNPKDLSIQNTQACNMHFKIS